MDVKLHSRAKDWLLESWLEVATRVSQGGRRNLSFVDLYAGDGINHATLPDGTTLDWEGSAIKMAQAARRSTRPATVFANEYNPKFHGSLLARLEPYRNVVDWPPLQEDANVAVHKILAKMNPRDYNFFFVDPFRHSDVTLDTLRRIAAFSVREPYRGNWFTRRPEIMFTFMTYGLALSTGENAVHTIAEFFCGFDWRSAVDSAKKEGASVQLAFVKALARAMRRLYSDGEGDPDQAVWPYEVRVGEGQIAYYIVFWSTHPLAARIYPTLLPYGRKFQEDIVATLVSLRHQARVLRKTKMRPLDKFPEAPSK